MSKKISLRFLTSAPRGRSFEFRQIDSTRIGRVAQRPSNARAALIPTIRGVWPSQNMGGPKNSVAQRRRGSRILTEAFLSTSAHNLARRRSERSVREISVDAKALITFASKLTRNQALAIVFSVVALVCPGMWVLCVYKWAEVLKTDTWKLLLLSASISAPFIVANTMATSTGLQDSAETASKPMDKTRNLITSLSFGCLATLFLFGWSTLLCFLTRVPFRSFVVCLLMLEIVAFFAIQKKIGKDTLPDHIVGTKQSDADTLPEARDYADSSAPTERETSKTTDTH